MREHSKGGGGVSHERRKAERALARNLRILGLSDITRQDRVLSIPDTTAEPSLSRHFSRKLLDLFEHPWVIASVVAVTGIVGVLFWTPVLIICGLCILAAFHRTKFTEGQTSKQKALSWSLLVLGTLVFLFASNFWIAKGMNRTKQELTDSLKAAIRQVLGMRGDAKLLRITGFNIERFPTQRAIRIKVIVRSTSYSEALPVSGSYLVTLDRDVMADPTAERALEEVLWKQFEATIDGSKARDTQMTVKPDTESGVLIDHVFGAEEYSKQNQVAYFMGRLNYQDVDGRWQHIDYCGFTHPVFAGADAVLCKNHN